MAENEVALANNPNLMGQVVTPPNQTAQILRQAGLLVGIAASVALGVAVVMWSQTPNYSLLYGNLSDRDVSAVMDALQSAAIQYKVDEASGGIMVPSAKLHEARIKLAASGLPKSTSMGFEMLQEEQGFGTSQFIEQARYQRALEAELSRSISKVSNVRSARVHLALPKESVFARDRKNPSASVLVDLYPGRRLEDGQIAAIAHMVAASVPNLTISGVTVVDQAGRLLSRAGEANELTVSAERFDYTKKIEDSYIKRIENILHPIVGMDHIRAQVTADIDFTSTEQTSETYNPDLPAVRSEQLTEEQRTGGAGPMGVPGALTNEPPGTGNAPEVAEGDGAEGATAAEQRQLRKKETRNFELDKTISHTRKAVGTIDRLSVAVVLNNPTATDEEGNVSQIDYSPDQIIEFTQLVKDAVGFNAVRGDTVSVISSNFTTAPPAEPLPEPAIWEQPWVWDVGKQVLGGIFVLYLLFGVLRPTIKNMMKKPEPVTQQVVMVGPDGQPLPPGATGTGEGAGDGEGGNESDESVPLLELGASSSYETSLNSVRDFVKEEPKLAAQVAKNWVGKEG